MFLAFVIVQGDVLLASLGATPAEKIRISFAISALPQIRNGHGLLEKYRLSKRRYGNRSFCAVSLRLHGPGGRIRNDSNGPAFPAEVVAPVAPGSWSPSASIPGRLRFPARIALGIHAEQAAPGNRLVTQQRIFAESGSDQSRLDHSAPRHQLWHQVQIRRPVVYLVRGGDRSR